MCRGHPLHQQQCLFSAWWKVSRFSQITDVHTSFKDLWGIPATHCCLLKLCLWAFFFALAEGQTPDVSSWFSDGDTITWQSGELLTVLLLLVISMIPCKTAPGDATKHWNSLFTQLNLHSHPDAVMSWAKNLSFEQFQSPACMSAVWVCPTCSALKYWKVWR